MPDLDVDTSAADVSTTATETSSAIPEGGGGDYQTDEQILGIETENVPQPDETETTEETPDATEAQPDTDTQKPVVDNYDWAKPLLRDRNIAPKLQSLIDREKAFVSTGLTVADARKFVETVPGGLSQVQALMQKSQEADEMDLNFTSGDPASQLTAIQGMYELDPEAFKSALPVSLDFLKRNDPEGYQQITEQFLSSTLNSERFGEHLAVMEQALASGDTEKLTKLVTNLVNWGKDKGLTGENDTRLSPREQQLQQREQKFQEQQAQAFRADVNRAVTAQVHAGINKIPLPETFSEEAKLKIRNEINSQISQMLNSDNSLLMKYKNGARSGDRKAVEESYTAKARLLLPVVAKKVVEEWTGYILAANTQRQQKTNAAATRKDITGGNGNMRAPSSRVKPSQVDYSKTSDEDILQGNVSLRKN